MGPVLRVAFLLGVRQIQRANIWTTVLVVLIMMLTFLSLVGVSGILVGLIAGSENANKEQYTGDVILSTPKGDSYIEDSQSIIKILETLPGIEAYSARYLTSATIEANYTTRRDPNEVRDSIGGVITGIDPLDEEATTHLSLYVAEGEFLSEGDEGYILIGKNMLQRYSSAFGDAFDTLEDVYPGTRVRIQSGEITKEVIVKGIIDSKVDETSFRIFMLDSEFKRIFGRTNLNVNEISVRLDGTQSAEDVKQSLLASGVGDYATIETFEEAIPEFLEDIKQTFAFLGLIIGMISAVVAAITIVVIIAINAITRRKYIGILKGIGVRSEAIILAYVMQGILYVVIGVGLASVVLFGLIIPGINANPIDFPFSDGILVATIPGTLTRFFFLLVVSIFSGWLPAWVIVRKNTLDAILGR